ERIARTAHPVLAAVNKIDRVRPRERLLPYLGELAARHAFLALVPVCALKADNIEALRDAIAAHLPLSPALFPDGELTDRGLPFRIAETIRDKLTREHGRLTLFARGVRGPSAKLASVLQPFQLLLLSWSGRGEAPQLTAAERARHDPALPPECLLAAFYLNELLIRLTTRHDPLPLLFDHYHGALTLLRAGAPLEPALRLFEKRLLEVLGYGLDLATEAHSGKRIEPEGYYHFRAGLGLVRASAAS